MSIAYTPRCLAGNKLKALENRCSICCYAVGLRCHRYCAENSLYPHGGAAFERPWHALRCGLRTRSRSCPKFAAIPLLENLTWKGARSTIAVLLSPKHSQRSRLLSNLEKTKQFAASALREDIMAIRNMRSAILQGCCTPSNSGRNRQTLGKATRQMPLIPVRVQFYTVQNALNKPHCIYSMFTYMYKQISATINFQNKKFAVLWTAVLSKYDSFHICICLNICF